MIGDRFLSRLDLSDQTKATLLGFSELILYMCTYFVGTVYRADAIQKADV